MAPFDGLDSFGSRINNLFDQALDRARRGAISASGVWSPSVDVLESKDSYLVRAELPGMNKEDFNLEVKDGMLTLSGERKLEEPLSGVEYRSVERVAGKFSRSFLSAPNRSAGWNPGDLSRGHLGDLRA
jgi:HSP20 family protein